MTARRWTLADILATDGLSRDAHVPVSQHGDRIVASWPSGIGWWWAVLDRFGWVLASGWTTGKERDKDAEVTLAIEKLTAPTLERAS